MPRPQAAPLTIVAMGTSLTARGGWQQPLREALERCLRRPVAVETVARSGASSSWGLKAVDEVAAKGPDVVLVEFATNDAALNRLLTRQASRTNLRAILARLSGLEPKPRIIVMAMNPVFGLRGLLRPFLSCYIEAHRELAAEFGAEFIDHGPAWRALGRQALRGAIPDGIHPEPAAAASVIVPALLGLLSEGRCLPAGAGRE